MPKSGYFGWPKGPASWAALCVTALIALEIARVWSALMPLIRLDTSTRPPADSAVEHTARADVARIATAHLFGTSNQNPTGSGTVIATSNSNLLLTGTFARRNPERGVAIISQGGKSRLYTVGARVGEATVAGVFRDHVILNRDGALESLSLPRPAPLAGGRVLQGASTPELVAGNDGNSTPGDPHGLADIMRAGGPVNDPSGRVRGFRIFPGRDRKAFGAMGLRGGDLVVAVNGTAMLEQDRQNTQELFRSIGTAERATMTIERNGRTSDITVDISQASLLSNSVVPEAPVDEN